MKNACIVGYGAIGPVHAKAISSNENICLYAVCETNPDRAKKCTDAYSDVVVYNDFYQMLKDDNIDVVHICTPHYLHFEMAKASLEAGKDIVLEKPVTIEREDFKKLEDICKNSNKKICIMLQNRTNPCIVKMKEVVDSGNYKLTGIVANMAWKRDEEYYNQDEWRGSWKYEGGGLIINQAVHLVDMMVYFGGKVKEVYSNLARWNVTNIEVEDSANALIKFDSGVNGIFSASNCHSANAPFYLELQFEGMCLRYADNVLYQIKGEDIQIICRDSQAFEGKKYWGNGHTRVIDAYYNSLEGGDSTYSNLDDSKQAMEVVYTMYEQCNKLKGQES